MRPLEEKEEIMFFLHPKNVNLSNEERKTATIVALVTTGTFLVFIGGLIGLVAWLDPGPHYKWVLDFTADPSGVAAIIICGTLWTYLPDALTRLLGHPFYKAWATCLIAVSVFALGLVIMFLGFNELYELKAYGHIGCMVLLVALVFAARYYRIAKHRTIDQPPPRSQRTNWFDRM